MNVFLWVLQGILAAAFLMAGLTKLTQPREKLLEMLAWVEDFSTPTLRFIGITGIAGALGLILPAATGIAPALTPVAAACIALVMVLAIGVHARRKEYPLIGINVVFFIMAAVIARGRFGAYGA